MGNKLQAGDKVIVVRGQMTEYFGMRGTVIKAYLTLGALIPMVTVLMEQVPKGHLHPEVNVYESSVDLISDAKQSIPCATELPPGVGRITGPEQSQSLSRVCTCPLHGPDGLMAVGCKCGAV
jgi:ribosomal protein L24